MRWLSITLFCLLALLGLDARPPQLEPRDVSVRLEEIMAAHAEHKQLTEELMARTVENFIDQFDQGKMYLLKHEVDAWKNTSMKEVLAQFQTNDFTLFATIYDQMQRAMARRRQLEATDFPVQDVDAKEFKDLKWAESLEELQARLHRLKTLQVDIMRRLDDESEEQISERLRKRRERLEKRLTGRSPKERQQVVLTYVLKATASALDSQTVYFTPDEASDFTIQLQQRLFGIGVQLRDQLSGLEVLRIIKGGPADRDGTLMEGDQIIAVDGESVIGLDIIDAVRQIRGKANTDVLLTVMRGQESFDVTMVRGEVVLEEARFETTTEPFGDGVIGRIALHGFYQDERDSSASDIEKAISRLKREHHLHGLILDLRQNGGGLLPQAVAVTSLFIRKGIVVSIKDETSKIQHLRDTNPRIAWDGPLIILVSRGTASAAEIVAGTLQDYGRAIVVGDQATFGKGTFQTSTIDALHGTRLDPKGEHKVTRGIYYTVSGRSPQLVGVQSDIVAPGFLSQLEIGEQFSKYPLANDQISPNFVDDLSDIPVFHRQQIRQTYLFDLQDRLSSYTSYLDMLRDNSIARIEKNPDYQNFLSQLEDEATDDLSSNDHQMRESLNIMKDLLFVLQTNEKAA